MPDEGGRHAAPSGAPWVELADAALARLAALTAEGADPALGDIDAALDRARVAFRASLDDATPFADVVANAALEPEEAEVLALAVACELDAARQGALAAVHGGRTRLRLDTVGWIFGTPHVVALGRDGGLRRSALVELLDDGAWSAQQVAVHPSLLWALVGDGGTDPALPVGTETVTTDVVGGAPLVLVTGPDRSRRRQTAAERTTGGRFVVTATPADDAEWSALVREATLCGAGVIVELDGSLPPEGRRRIEQATHVAWGLSTAIEPPLGEMPARPWLEVDAEAVEPTDDEWRRSLGDGTARSHHLTYDQLLAVERVLPATGGDLDAAVRRLGGGRLERLARRIRPSRSWSHIVLSPERVEQLRAVVDRYRHAERVYDQWGFAAIPSRGVIALFSGPSGTGKTLAAEVVAGELGLDVFKLDLSAVVSKYIGETEKNLEQVFDAAGAGNVVLFFDEADALFGKRSEVRDARDRYANIEVSYLLQRLERYDGVAVLATNFEQNLDDAFMRRLHARIEFVLPAEDERRAIWTLNLPAGAPVDDIDVDWLASSFELSGASIRNAALNAAFEAAASGEPITMGTAVRGVARELRKMGRLLKPDAFGPYGDLVPSTAALGNGPGNGPGGGRDSAAAGARRPAPRAP